jgi:hypothetical protein
MALVDCIECKKQISDRAVSCPHCGCPLIPSVAYPPPAAQIPGSSGPIVTIQQTKKTYKGHQLGALVLVGIALLVISSGAVGLGFVLLLCAVAWLIAASAGAWWDHG